MNFVSSEPWKLLEISGKWRFHQGDVVEYQFPLGSEKILMNQLIGSQIIMTFLGAIHCIRCGRETRKSFAQGYCYPCFSTAPETEECVLRPELCRAHEGVATGYGLCQKALSDRAGGLSFPNQWTEGGGYPCIPGSCSLDRPGSDTGPLNWPGCPNRLYCRRDGSCFERPI